MPSKSDPHAPRPNAAFLSYCDSQRLRQAEVLRVLGTHGPKFEHVGKQLFNRKGKLFPNEQTALQVVTFMFGFQRGPGGRDNIQRPRFSPETMMPNGDRNMALSRIGEAAARKYHDNQISERHLQRLFRKMVAKGLILVPMDKSSQSDGKHWDRELIYALNVERLWEMINRPVQAARGEKPSATGKREFVKKGSKTASFSTPSSATESAVVPSKGDRGSALPGVVLTSCPHGEGICTDVPSDQKPFLSEDPQQPQDPAERGEAAQPADESDLVLKDKNGINIDPGVSLESRPGGQSFKLTPSTQAIPYNHGPAQWSVLAHEVEMSRQIGDVFSRKLGIRSWNLLTEVTRIQESRGALTKTRLALVLKLLFSVETDNPLVNAHPLVVACNGARILNTPYANQSDSKLQTVLHHCYPVLLNPSGAGDSKEWQARRDPVAFLDSWWTIWREIERLTLQVEREQLAALDVKIYAAKPEFFAGAVACRRDRYTPSDDERHAMEAWLDLVPRDADRLKHSFELLALVHDGAHPQSVITDQHLRQAVDYCKLVPTLVKPFAAAGYPVRQWFSQAGESFEAAARSGEDLRRTAIRLRVQQSYKGAGQRKVQHHAQ